MYSVLVTAGPTHEFIDRVRYIANSSSGKQGYFIAESFSKIGCDVNLISGPTAIPKPGSCKIVDVVSCEDMMNACKAALPVDIAICAAAVCDFKPKEFFDRKLTKTDLSHIEVELTQDILKYISMHSTHRPKVVVGFSLECTQNIELSMEKLADKKCDILISNLLELDGGESVMGSDYNKVSILSLKQAPVHLPMMQKSKVADYITRYITDYIKII